MRIHLVGASGTGTTTLGKALREAHPELVHLDIDDFVWFPEEPPFCRKREPAQRLAQLEPVLRLESSSVTTGSLCEWGDPLAELFDLVFFLQAPTEIRMERIKRRESATFGTEIEESGSRYEKYQKFLVWARRYDTAGLEQRSLITHRSWLSTLSCPVFELDATLPISILVQQIESSILKTYRKLARGSRKGMVAAREQAIRLMLKDQIASWAADDRSATRALLAAASSPRCFGGRTYAQVAAEATDGNAFGQGIRREASLVESLHQSQVLESVLKDVKDTVEPLLPTMFVFGSCCYSLYFNIKLDSDIDLQSVVDHLDPRICHTPALAPLGSRFARAIDRFNSDPELHNLACKTYWKGIQLSFHFMKRDTFRRVTDLNPFSSPGSVAEYRLEPRRKGYTYWGLGFDADTISFDCSQTVGEDGLVVKIPDYGMQGRKFISGFFIDRFINCRPLFGVSEEIADSLKNLRLQLVRRLVHEEQGGIITRGHLHNICARHPSFSRSYKDGLLREERLLREKCVHAEV